MQNQQKQELEQVKLYLRIDGDEDDINLISFINAAHLYLRNAGVSCKSNDLYDLAVKIYVSLHYDDMSKAQTEKLERSLESIVVQLKYEVDL
ncbi:phage gp6-like head-tail connector protein [Bacillus sp. AY18-3]|uniref:head-tail connector protein n=1 Tax=Bacillus sp. AY18-3 TaxID=2217814 RepID=UPI0011C8A749|nr:head-tail connector protein [Bacillus sp. AY18-3]TXR64184.1 phage gp6-like head-tail connector protein [Bacillus sp. AY18-3]